MSAHPNKHIRAALKYAEQQGWSIRKSSGRAHAWGVLYCQFGHRECWMSVYSTPKNSEKHARDIRRTVDRCPEQQREAKKMNEYRFSLIVATNPMTHDDILDVTDTLGQAGCTDASIRGHAKGMELLFERSAEELQAAISSAISDVEQAGFRVQTVEMEREAIFA